MDFSRFDDMVDYEQLQKEIEEAKSNGTGDYAPLEDGEYHGKFEKLEVGETKDHRPMMKAMFRITEGEHKKQCIFMNRVLYGTKNDANMIKSALGWLLTLEPSEDIDVTFKTYSQFADMVLDVAEDISELEYDIEYKESAFNNITIKDVIE